MANLALSAREQIQQQVEKDLEPKLDKLLAQKVKPHAIRKTGKKETVFRKGRDVKYRTGDYSSSKAAKQQFKRTDPEFQDKPVDNKSTLFKFSK